MANGLGSLQAFNPQSVFPRGFSIGMDPRPFLAQSGLQIQGNRVVPMPGFSQPTAPAPQPVAPPIAQPTPQPMPQPTPPPMIPQPQPALPSEQLNIQPPMGIPTTPPVQEPPPMAPPVMEQPPMAPPVMDQSDNDFARSFFGRLRDSGVNFPEQPIASTPQPDDSMMRPMPLPEFGIPTRPVSMPTPPPRFGLEGILGGFDRFRPTPPPRFGLPVGFRPARRPFPPGFGESPMRNFREMRGIGLRNPFFGPRRQG